MSASIGRSLRLLFVLPGCIAISAIGIQTTAKPQTSKQTAAKSKTSKQTAAKPKTSKVRHCFKFGDGHRFHLEGTDFDTVTHVRLVDPAAKWVPERVEKKDFTEQTKTSLQFFSTPQPQKKGSRPPGTLTITVTNSAGDDMSPPSVDTSYVP